MNDMDLIKELMGDALTDDEREMFDDIYTTNQNKDFDEDIENLWPECPF